jgi:ATP-dependent DNA ligase
MCLAAVEKPLVNSNGLLGCECFLSKLLGSLYRSGRSQHWLKIKNPAAPAVKREAEEDWGR